MNFRAFKSPYPVDERYSKKVAYFSMQVFDAAYAWIWMHKTEEWYKKKLPLTELTKVLDNYGSIPGIRTWFTSNHDENSWNGNEYERQRQNHRDIKQLSG